MNQFVGLPFLAVVDNGSAGLVGNIRVEVYDPATGAVLVGPIVDVVEPQPGTYQAQLVVGVAGLFRVRWSYDSPGGVVTAEEPLSVWPHATAGAEGGALGDLLVHVAIPTRYEEDPGVGEWIEGEPGPQGPEPVTGVAFPLVLFLPLGTEEAPGTESPRGRKVSRPTIMFEPLRPLGWPQQPGTPITLGADDELLIFAPELAQFFEQVAGEAIGTGRWQVEGAPQPFGPPGEVIGVQANVKQVRD